MSKKSAKKKMSQEKKSANQVRRERQQLVARIGAVFLVVVMVASLIAMYAL